MDCQQKKRTKMTNEDPPLFNYKTVEMFNYETVKMSNYKTAKMLVRIHMSMILNAKILTST